MSTYTPSYVWPNPAFPFRVYLDHPKLRIFIIENIHHNWNWMSEWSHKFKKSDFFFVYCGWYHGIEFAKEANKLFESLGLNKSNFYFLFNSTEELNIFEDHGFYGKLVNHNAWLDSDSTMRPIPVVKEYDAIYVARRSSFKRHMLANKITNLCLVAGINHGNAVSDIPQNYKYLNTQQLNPDEVCIKINESRCGLILSAVEGACFASSEYLLCGIPVVSTHSKGGRETWYNEYNSIITEPTPDHIFAAVEEFKRHPRNPEIIRQMHIDQAALYRNNFVLMLFEVFKKTGVNDIDPFAYFKETYFHKLRKSYKPNFSEIFSDQ
jgi:glycosyltransferase involved in cell wall biosynthesis